MYSKWVSAGAHRAPNLGVLIRKSAPTSAYDPARAQICCPLDLAVQHEWFRGWGEARTLVPVPAGSLPGQAGCRPRGWALTTPTEVPRIVPATRFLPALDNCVSCASESVNSEKVVTSQTRSTWHSSWHEISSPGV
jgi:hypothetical protein